MHTDGHHHGQQGVMMGHHGPHAWNAPEEAAARPNPVAADAASLTRGKALFAQHCIACHGKTGQGTGPLAASLKPPPADLQVMGTLHPPGDLAWKIAEGRGAMPGWAGTLSQREIWDTVNYIQHLDGLVQVEDNDPPGAWHHEPHGHHDHHN
jgi:mono/diheme cytochrome c family protein